MMSNLDGISVERGGTKAELHPRYPDPTRGGQQGKFCHWCGLPLVERSIPSGYNSQTGQPEYETRKDCPRILGLVPA